jgi:radical SAM superfamily enzyme YgiQ (UPF0313 family)
VIDLLLTHGYILGEDERERAVMKPYPPLGLLYLSAFLKQQGFAVEVLDPTLSDRDAVEARLGRNPSVLGLYATFMTRPSVLRIVTAARDRGWTVLVGGPDAGAHATRYLAHGAHVAVSGEGEATLAELLTKLAAGGPHDLHGVAGTSFVDGDGTVCTNPARPLIRNLDELPWPDRDAIDMGSYLEVWRRHHGRSSVNLITGRGCAFRCAWCSHAVYGRSHRRRSPADCADEVAAIVDTYGPDQLWYADDVFTLNHDWLQVFAGELARRRLHLPFETITRADRFLEPEVARTLAGMGCERLWIGGESGSDAILEAMQRDVTAEQIRRAARLAVEHGIEVGLFVMWGYAGERPEDVERTVEMVCDVQPATVVTGVSYPIDGTAFHDAVRSQVVAPGPWHATPDRDHDIAGRPARDHYRHADAWLKAAVAAVGEHDPDRTAALRADAADARARFESWWQDAT